MVLDYLISPREAKRKPHEVFIVAALFVSFAVLVQMFIPSVKGSIIIFAMVPAIPLMWSLLVREEHDEEAEIQACYRTHYWEGASVTSILARHAALVEVFSFFFLGAVFAYSVWYAALPAQQTQALYADQMNELNAIKGITTGRFFDSARFEYLFTHNLQVLGLMFAFCLVYGMGSVYLLLWNASIIGLVIGSKINEGVLGVVMGFVSLLPHGIFEIAAYFVASIAGGILSVAVMRKHYKSGCFKFVLRDVIALTAISLILLAIGAAIESSY
ncbi:Stage II sporulation protein M [Candidatus Norongarragalina meridionalis]|nr:Stage II sporulation protein M [Candidatus Norongarragalina meridionalis]